MSDKVGVNRKIEQAAEQGLKTAKQAAPAQSPIGKAIGAANTAMGVYGQVMGFTGGLAEKAVLPLMQQLSFLQGLACLPASSHLDPVMGIDVHFVMIPPSPSPIPMPHPFIAMVMDPKDWLSCAVMTVAAMAAPVPTGNDDADAAAALAFSVATMALGMAGMSATVKLGSFTPRSVTGVKNKVIPHFPMGASFAPMPVLKNSGHVQFGSLFMLADGNPFTGLMHLNNDCWDVGIMQLLRKKYPAEPMHLYLPTGFIMAIPSHNVIVNPIPTPINPIAALAKLFNMGLGKLLHGIVNKMPFLGRVGNAMHKAICHVTGHPVDVVSGMLFTDEEDFSLPGVIPLLWERTWYSDSVYKGPMGHGWYHNYDMGFFIDGETGQGVFRMNDGRPAVFEVPEPGKCTFNRTEKLWLYHHATEGYYYIINNEGLIHRFTTRQYEHTAHKQQQHLLQSISNHNGYAIRLEYNSRGNLVKIIDSAGRMLKVVNDLEGRITEIIVPHPTDRDKTFVITRYQYDDDGNMICHTDALEQPMKYEYEHHLLVKETWRDGQEWHFVYEGKTNGSRCIHTWGPENLYNHKLTYLEGVTHVENSLGFVTTYNHKQGLLYSKIDANGGEWGYRYNRFNELEWETDPLGNQHAYTHDEWGNIAATIDPVGGFTYAEYFHPSFPYLPTESIDKAGGRCKWEYDDKGNLLEFTDALGASTAYEYVDGLVVKVTNAAGVATFLQYNETKNLITVKRADGSAVHYSYNVLGDCIQVINIYGNKQTCFFDLKGRVTGVHDFDGNKIDQTYDGIDNVIRYKDSQRDIAYTYKGLWNVATRTEDGATVYLNYDSEEQLRQVINEHGQSFVFELDPVGNVVRETGFDKITRQYERDLCGWIKQIKRPKNKLTTIEYDACGRVISMQFNEREKLLYVYRPDGRLIKAGNEHTVIEYKRDVGGHVLQETINGEWIATGYDVFGNRTQTTSSLGANIQYQYNAAGDMLQTEANGWMAKFEYDRLGLEIARVLPGGISCHCLRDGTGRLLSQVAGRDKGNELYSRQYTWDIKNRLKQIKDIAGVTRFEYDTRGNLNKAIFPGNEEQYRNPDAVGNLFTSADRKDRLYSKGGQLKKAKGWEYVYDAEGNLIERKHNNGSSWLYHWNDAGLLVKVTKPDKTEVSFTYDALSRRITKQYKNTTTRFLWDGSVLLHEWKQFASKEKSTDISFDGEVGIITWVFERESFVPCAKIKGDKRYSILTDQAGTPTTMCKEDGTLFWQGALDSYGNMRMEKGETGSCPFRYQGQYDDHETGLYYNRFRYYAPGDGVYISQDPIGLMGGFVLYGYVVDTNIEVDILGLMPLMTGTTPGGMDRNSPEWRSRYGPASSREHHLVPQAMLNDPAFMKQMDAVNNGKGADYLHRQIAIIPNELHTNVHDNGWNKQFKAWAKANPNFTKKQLQQQIKKMMKEHNIPKSSRNFAKSYGRK